MDELQLPIGTEQPTHDQIMDDTAVSAFVPDAFGNPHPCAMPIWCWHYLAWLIKRGFKISDWIVDLDMTRDDYPLDRYLIDGIVRDFEERKEAGKKLPAWLENGDYV